VGILREIVQLAWERFKLISSVMGDSQSRFIMVVFYFTVLLPFGLGSRFLSDPLARKSATHPAWLDRSPTAETLADAQRQG
jgi:hypothetical protein